MGLHLTGGGGFLFRMSNTVASLASVSNPLVTVNFFCTADSSIICMFCMTLATEN